MLHQKLFYCIIYEITTWTILDLKKQAFVVQKSFELPLCRQAIVNVVKSQKMQNKVWNFDIPSNQATFFGELFSPNC